MTFKKLALGAGLTLAMSILSACGGGGGGGGTGGGGGSYTPPPVDSGDILRYPYETVYGDACRSSSELTPGCTFVRSTGNRATVSMDPDYNSQGYGSDDLWYVRFDSYGNATVYDDLGNAQRDAYGNIKVYRPSDFAGWVSGNTIGVGVTGAFWENVAGGTYWFGKNGVLFSANVGAGNYGQAINNKNAGKGNNTNSKALKSEANKKLILAGAAKLKELGLSQAKAVAVASAMNSVAVMSAERGKISETDFDRALKTMTGGVGMRDALAAFKSFSEGNKAPARELANRSASALGLTPEEGEKYIKALYRSSVLKSTGVDINAVSLQD